MVGTAAVRGQDFLRTSQLHLPAAPRGSTNAVRLLRPDLGSPPALLGGVKRGDAMQEAMRATPQRGKKLIFPAAAYSGDSPSLDSWEQT